MRACRANHFLLHPLQIRRSPGWVPILFQLPFQLYPRSPPRSRPTPTHRELYATCSRSGGRTSLSAPSLASYPRPHLLGPSPLTLCFWPVPPLHTRPSCTSFNLKMVSAYCMRFWELPVLSLDSFEVTLTKKRLKRLLDLALQQSLLSLLQSSFA